MSKCGEFSDEFTGDREKLLSLTASLRQQVVAESKGLRWCWIGEWESERQIYRLGVKYEGQCTWVPYPYVVQIGSGPAAFEIIDKLNEREGLSHDEWWGIWKSGRSSASAVLNEDETEVLLLIAAPINPHEFRSSPSTRGQMSVFGLEHDLAFDVFRGLNSINNKFILPNPTEESPKVKIEVNDDSDVLLFVPGECAADPLDAHRFTLTLDLQTAADLFEAMSDVFAFDLMCLDSPEDLFGEN